MDDAALQMTWNSGEVTGASADDTASVTGTSGTPTGTETYSWFANDTCAGGATTTHMVTMASGSVPNSTVTPALSPLSYSYEANYSGDAHYLASQGACESFIVHQATADAGTVVKDSALSSPWNGTEATGACYDRRERTRRSPIEAAPLRELWHRGRRSGTRPLVEIKSQYGVNPATAQRGVICRAVVHGDESAKILHGQVPRRPRLADDDGLCHREGTEATGAAGI